MPSTCRELFEVGEMIMRCHLVGIEVWSWPVKGLIRTAEGEISQLECSGGSRRRNWLVNSPTCTEVDDEDADDETALSDACWTFTLGPGDAGGPPKWPLFLALSTILYAIALQLRRGRRSTDECYQDVRGGLVKNRRDLSKAVRLEVLCPCPAQGFLEPPTKRRIGGAKQKLLGKRRKSSKHENEKNELTVFQ